MNIAIVTCVWKRPHVARYTFENWKTFGYPIVAVGSEGEVSRSLCEPYAHYIEHENQPLGRKFNAGVTAARELDPDFVLIMGSDQVVEQGIFDHYEKLIAEGEAYMGIYDTYFYDVPTQKLSYWQGYGDGRIIGPGRLIYKKLLDLIDWKPYADSAVGNLDHTMNKAFPKPRAFYSKPYAMTSIKTEESLNQANLFKTEEADPSSFHFRFDVLNNQ